MVKAFLFPGQGSQSVGMGRWAYEKFSLVKNTYEEAGKALGEDLTHLMMNGPEEKLNETANAQPAILTASVGMGRVLLEKGIEPQVLAGHSLGEYTALVLAGALSFEDAVQLVRGRGKYMQEAVPLGVGGMLAVLGMKDEDVEKICALVAEETNETVEPANYNCPGQLVISGTLKGLEAATPKLKEAGAKRCVSLDVSAPFHSSLLKPAADQLRVDLEKVTFSQPKVPYFANVDAELVTSSDSILDRLVDQVWKPVRWSQSLVRIVDEFQPKAVIEVGAAQVVSGHMKKVRPDIPRFHTSSEESFQKLLGEI